MKNINSIVRHFAFLLMLGHTSCLNHSDSNKKTQFGISDAMEIILESEERWNENSRSYEYRYLYYTGMVSSTKSGVCEIGDIVSCKWMDGIGESGVSKDPGKIQSYIDRIKTMSAEISPDTIHQIGNLAFSYFEVVNVNDSLKIPHGYSVWFNAELGHIDSVFIYPFGSQLRVLSLTLIDK